MGVALQTGRAAEMPPEGSDLPQALLEQGSGDTEEEDPGPRG